MSDDRFKQARRSLLDRQNQQRQGGQDNFSDDFEDEATALVDLNSVQRPPSGQQPPAGQQPGYGQQQQGHHPPPPGMEDDKTEMISLSDMPQQGGQPRGEHPSLMIGDGGSLGHQRNPHTDQPTAPSYDTGDRKASQQASSSPSPVVIGDASDFEGSTQFINISEFAQESGPQVTPDDHEAGYEGSTQFINLAELQAGAAAHGAGPTIENDAVLKQGYQFGTDSIQKGDFTLIFAQNAMGKPVILKQIWEGDTTSMPAEVRQRVAALDQIRHPRLVALNGMLASETGAWVELDRPPGYRLSDIVQQNGPQPKEQVMQWMKQVGEVLSTVHARGFAYANLTTDAVWVQEDGSVVLEPFDVLTFENRGNLGVFGAPELNVPPQQMILSPATDVYSLACVLAASLTGLPLNLGAVGTLPKPLPDAIMHALQQNPAERTPTVEQFFNEVSKSGGGLPELDMKLVIGAVAVIGVVGLGAAFALQGSGGSAPDPGASDPGIVEPGEPGEPSEPKSNGGGEPAGAKVEPPGEVFRHESITIETSYVLNPPQLDGSEGLSAEVGDPEELRAEAREVIKGADRLVKDSQLDKYREALQKMMLAVRLSEMTEDDKEFIEDLLAQSVVKELRESMHERINTAFREENLSSVKTLYPKLAAQENLKDFQFFTDNKAVGVKKISRDGASAEEEE